MHAWFEFCIDSDGHDGMSLCCSGCLPPAVSRRADCRCDEPSEGVYVTKSTASRHSWPPDMDHGLFVLPGVGVSAENRGGVIGQRVENVGILSPEAVASGERERSQHQECLDAVFVDEVVHCIKVAG